MANHPLRCVAAFFAANLSYPCVSRLPADAADGPNRVTPSDVAAGRWVDSLLDPNLAAMTRSRTGLPCVRRDGLRSSGQVCEASWSRTRNSNDGAPPFALVDRYGGIFRYIEPVDSVRSAGTSGSSGCRQT